MDRVRELVGAAGRTPAEGAGERRPARAADDRARAVRGPGVDDRRRAHRRFPRARFLVRGGAAAWHVGPRLGARHGRRRDLHHGRRRREQRALHARLRPHLVHGRRPAPDHALGRYGPQTRGAHHGRGRRR